MINERGQLIELTTTEDGVVYCSASQIASFQAGTPGSVVELLVQNKPTTYHCVEIPATIALQGPFVAMTVTATGTTLYLNANRISFVKADGTGSVVMYMESGPFKKVAVTESPEDLGIAIATAVAGTGNVRYATITWDSAVSGPFAGAGFDALELGIYGKAGTYVSPVYVYGYFDTLDPGFVGGSVGTANAYVIVCGTIGPGPAPGAGQYYYYTDDNPPPPASDPIVGVTTFVPSTNADGPIANTFTAPAPINVYVENGGGTFSMTGKMVLNICYVEQAI